MELADGWYQLEIKNCSSEDAGTYVCHAANPLGAVLSHARLYVTREMTDSGTRNTLDTSEDLISSLNEQTPGLFLPAEMSEKNVRREVLLSHPVQILAVTPGT